METYLREELTRIRQELTGLRSDLPDVYIPRREFEASKTHMQQRVSDLENWQTWATRIILGAVLTAIVGAVLTGVIVSP